MSIGIAIIPDGYLVNAKWWGYKDGDGGSKEFNLAMKNQKILTLGGYFETGL